ncbi:quinone oxidoreductase (plasmid) [Paraburkholderia hospita]|nr:quinone oxidoreductase [Paraburkholderia hospita]
MIALRVAQFGGPEAIYTEHIPLPEPEEDEVLVKIFAAGVGPWDAWIRSGRSVLPQPLPLTLGSDISGVVVAIGEGTRGFAVGELVYGVTNKRFTNGYAQYAACRAEMLARKPAALSFTQAASVPVVAVTAWQMLFEYAGLKSGRRVLIHGAAGSVGRYAVQLAHAAGLTVVATGSDNVSTELLALGASQVIGRDLSPVTKVDAVIDLVGGDSQAHLFEFISAGGKLVSAVSNPDPRLACAHGVSAEFMLVAVNTASLDSVRALFDDGRLRTWVGTVLPLDAARRAHEMMAGTVPHPPGKIVLEVSH